MSLYIFRNFLINCVYFVIMNLYIELLFRTSILHYNNSIHISLTLSYTERVSLISHTPYASDLHHLHYTLMRMTIRLGVLVAEAIRVISLISLISLISHIPYASNLHHLHYTLMRMTIRLRVLVVAEAIRVIIWFRVRWIKNITIKHFECGRLYSTGDHCCLHA